MKEGSRVRGYKGSKITVRTPAKINLTLQIFHKRPDGYHELETVMQSVDLLDRVGIRERKTGGRGQGRKENTISVKCFPKRFNVPENENNLCYKATELFLREAKLNGKHIEITLYKKIPPGSGLGGGSGNAAGCLKALKRLFPGNVSNKRLALLAGEIGSDVPFFLHGGLAVCKGRGERVIPQRAFVDFFAVLAVPGFSLSTKKVYENLPSLKTQKNTVKSSGRYSARLLQALRNGNFNALNDVLKNDLGKSRLDAMMVIQSIKDALVNAGAEGSAMSGSGSCVYGIFSSRDGAKRALKVLQYSLKSCTLFFTRSIPDGVRITS